MITLPAGVHPNGATPSFITFGGVQRPATGGKATSTERMGDRFSVSFSLPPLDEAAARLTVARLVRAMREGIRVPYPLPFTDQGAPGAPVVDGADQSGRTIAVRALNPGYGVLEGYWLSIVNADGQHYLHNAAAGIVAASDGTAEIAIEPMLRTDFADGAEVHLRTPMIEGMVADNSISWDVDDEGKVLIGFTVEEMG